jgi:hypothetical protein
VRRGGKDLGDDVAGAQDDHLLAFADVLAGEVLLVVQRGQLDRHSSHAHGLEHGVGMQVTELAGIPTDSLELGYGRGGRELPRDRPPRIATDHAQAPLQRELVDLDHDAVDLELERAPALFPGLALSHHLVLGKELLDVGMDREAVGPEPLQRLPVRRQGQTLGDPDLVAPQRQGTVRGQLGIELADCARGRVAGVHERREAGFGAPLVQGREVWQRHVDLAAHLEQRWRRVHVQPQRDRSDRAQVVGDVLPDFPIAAGGSAFEYAVAIEQRDGQAIDLGLGHEFEVGGLDPLSGQVVAHSLHPGPELLGRAGVGQGEHRLGVAHLDQVADRFAAHALGGGVGRE